MQSEFNPTDTKYESVDDLPEEQQDKFVDFGNGFIRAETAQNYSHDTETARILNSSHSIFDKILGRDISGLDIAQEKAKWLNELETRSQKNDEIETRTQRNNASQLPIEKSRLSDDKKMYGSIPITRRYPEVYYRLFDLEGSEDISIFFKDKVVLDLGAGFSEFVDDLNTRGITQTAYAVDFIYDVLDSPSGSENFGDGLPTKDARVTARLQQLPFADNSIDIAVASKSLPLHAQTKKDISDFFDELVRVLKSGGEARVSPVKCLNQWMGKPTDLWERLFPKRRLPPIDYRVRWKESIHYGLSEFEYLVFLRERYIQAEKWTEECIQTLKNNPDLEIKITEPKIFAAKPEIKRKKDVLIIKKK